ncbi:ABC transporter permease [Aliiroseovarius sp. S1339]|uniref:ABC transporter permease n=1 Tax=Aliiroseovarius sp. S1339 TaxID=2936990 RepID=UPI0020BDB8A0|nr:ABC transporter permease [Aliiroseovarius sp. S1339]MCK8465487.1 ABC transporter permease [Aliiroseovarius sp. S1339]
MFTYTLRRLAFSVPVLLAISLVIFLLIDLAPNDPTANLPLTIPPEMREQIRTSLGLDAPTHVRYLLWCKQFFIYEPLNLIEALTGWGGLGEDRLRVQSWSARAPVVDLIVERLPQTLWVVGLAMLIGIMIALPLGILSAYRQYGWVDQVGTFIAMVGFSVPSFFLGVLMIIIFSVKLGWFPSIYDTTHKVSDWQSFVVQMRQMIMPVAVLALYNAAQFSRYMRAAILDNLHQDYVRTARAKGMSEVRVMLGHVLRNSMIPVVTVISLTVPHVFAGAIITEQVFKVNGLGQLLISGIQNGDVPLVQTLTFLFAVLIVAFNLMADILYGLLDPRIRYD